MLQPARDGLLKAALATRWHGLEAHAIDALAGADPGLHRSSNHQRLLGTLALGTSTVSTLGMSLMRIIG